MYVSSSLVTILGLKKLEKLYDNGELVLDHLLVERIAVYLNP